MNLHELIGLIGDEAVIEILHPDGGWNDYDIFHIYSGLLIPFHNLKVTGISAVKEDTFRVKLDFREMKRGDADAD